jgi:fructose-1,6-bisphosphatase II
MTTDGPLGTCPCALFARATEWAALAGARWLGRDDQDAAEEAANGAMLAGLAGLPISGTIVIGSDQGIELEPGSSIGTGGEAFDLAVDPLEGRGVVARGGNGAMSMIAVGPPASLLKLPDMYMRRMAVGPRARGRIDLTRPIGENVAAIADAFGRNANDITALVLDRPRHHDLISAAIRGTNDHLAVGIGGTRQAVLSAAALRCLGGELQSQLWPTTRAEIDAAAEHGVEDVNRVFSSDELAHGEVIVVATGVSNGDLLRGVRFLADSARTHSLVMCMRCNWVRFAESIHFFARERKEEVRLLG